MTVTGMTNFLSLLCERLVNAKFAHLPSFFMGILHTLMPLVSHPLIHS